MFRICEIVFSSSNIIHATPVEKKLSVNVGYAYKLLRKLEKLDVLKGLRDPINGKLAFRPGTSKTARLVAEEIKKRKAREIEKVLVEVGVPW